MIEDWMAGFDSDAAVLERLEACRVPCGPVLNPADAIHHPYFVGRGTVREVDDRILGTLTLPGFPLRFSEQASYPARAAPLLGEHNDAVLREVAGYDTARIAGLRSSGVLHAADS